MISGTIQLTDFLSAQRLHRKPSKKIRVVYFVLFSFSVIAGSISLWLHHFVLGSAFLGAAIGGVIGESAVRYLYVPWWARRIYRQQKNLHESFKYWWDIEQLSGESKSGRGQRPWKHYTKWKENEDVFLVYHSDVLFEMVPKKWFKEPNQLNNFREHLQKYIVTKLLVRADAV